MNDVVFSTSTAVQPTTLDRNRLALARVAAAGRIQAEREAAQAKRRARLAEAAAHEAAFVAEIKALGGTAVNVKVCYHDGYKLRLGDVSVEEAASWVTRRDRDADVEACVLGADGEPLVDHDGIPVYV